MRPTGFAGPVPRLGDLRPAADRVLLLPSSFEVVERWRSERGEGEILDRIDVLALTESMGRVEALFSDLAAMLAPAGRLLVDVENAQSLRQLRSAIEGRPGPFDPVGSLEDPSRPLSRSRLVHAISVTGLRVEDIYDVPQPRGDLPDGFAAAASRHGFVPLAWIDGPPASRFWMVARKEPLAVGTVLVGPGSEMAVEHTMRRLRQFLPRGWETICPAGDSEAEAANCGIAAARGEYVWFLRAGSEPTEEVFSALRDRAVLGPVAPGIDGVRQHPGDLCGMMVARSALLIAGPIPRRWRNSQIAFEDYLMRLELAAGKTAVVGGELLAGPPPIDDPKAFPREAGELMELWEPVTRRGEASGGAGSPGATPDPTAAAKPARRAAGPDRGSATSVPPWVNRKPRISLCMIARNEQDFLGECLRRARDAADEIVVVDTGSTDDTVKIAESFGARVLHLPWEDDFSAPRNLALSHATGDWILVLDADEFLVGDACARIRELVEDPTVCGYHMRFTNAYTGGKTIGVMMVRLFRNLTGVEYVNCIHEQVTPSLVRIGADMGLRLSTCDVEVLHEGYTDEVMDSRRKNERNERLFRKQLGQTPDDIYTLYKYGDFLRRVQGRSLDARKMLERCLDLILEGPPSLPRELPYAGEVAALCALEYAREGRNDRARSIVDTALRRFLATPNLHYIAASLDLADGRADEAILQLRRCLSYRDQVLVVPIQEGITGHVSLTGIAQALLLKSDFEGAERLLRQSLALAPDYEVAHLVLSRLHLLRNDPNAALQVLTDYLIRHPDSPGICQQVALILHHLGLCDQARRMGRQALDLLRDRGQDHEAEHMKRILAAL
ncbi:MAG: hypothetical protein Fur0037_01320 [Planctomycetota bacterium]